MRKRGDTEQGARTAPVATAGSWSIPRGLIVVLAAAATVVAIAGMKAFAGVLGPAFLALMLTVAVQPVQGWVRRRGLKPWVGMVVAVLAVVAILVVLLGALALSAARLATQLPEYSDRIDELLDGIRARLADAGVDTEQIHNMLGSLDVNQLVGVLENVLRGLLGVSSNLIFVVALVLFMAIDGMIIGRKLAVVAAVRPEIAYALEAFARGTRKYLVVATVFGLIVGIFDGVALWWMGVPLPVLWAVLSFITNYIPNVGFIIGLVPPALLALLDSGWVLMVWVIVVYSVINFIIQSIIQPKYVGDSVGLGVTVTFLSLVFWSWVLGALGALLAIPLTLLVKAVVLDIDPTTRWVNTLISDKPPAPVESESDRGASSPGTHDAAPEPDR